MLSHINIGTGKDVTIKELAETVSQVTDFNGRIVFDDSKPEGTTRKLTNVSRLSGMVGNTMLNLEMVLQRPMTGI